MNYRHAFHAGNHADVLKHITVVCALRYLTIKDKPLAVLDAHAGIGTYDLAGVEAFKTGEWKGGIGRLLEFPLEGEAGRLASPYMDIVTATNQSKALRHYPGSPEILSRLLRPTDRLLLNELHPDDFNLLAARYGMDRRVRVFREDALTAVKSQLPFPEKRGLVLVDPAYEVTDEMARLSRLVAQGLKRMETCCFLVWYPVTTVTFADDVAAALKAVSNRPALDVRMMVREPFDGGGLAGSGLVCINPPWTLHNDMQIVVPELAKRLGHGNWGRGHVKWLTPPA